MYEYVDQSKIRNLLLYNKHAVFQHTIYLMDTLSSYLLFDEIYNLIIWFTLKFASGTSVFPDEKCIFLVAS